MKRPITVTVVALVSIFYYLLKTIYPLQAILHRPVHLTPVMQSIMHQLLIGCAISLCLFIASIGIFKGRDSARWFYLIVQAGSWVYLIATAGFKGVMFIPIVVSAVILVILFLPNATKYFKYQTQLKENSSSEE